MRAWSVRSGVAASPFSGPPRESSGADRGAHLPGEPYQEPHVVQRQQPKSQQLFGHEQVPQVAARERGARLAIARRVERPRVVAVLGVADVHRAVGRERRTVAPVARGRDAVEQVEAALHCRDEVLGEPHAHKITRPGGGQPGLEALEHLVHHGLRLSYRQPADGEAGPRTEIQDPAQTFLAQPEVGTALEDGPETLAAGRIAGWTVRTIRLTA